MIIHYTVGHIQKGVTRMINRIKISLENVHINDDFSISISCSNEEKTEIPVQSKEEADVMTVEKACAMLGAMIHKIAHKYSQQNPSIYNDLVNEGYMALYENFDGFDPAKGASISTFMYPHILHRCFDFASSKKSV